MRLDQGHLEGLPLPAHGGYISRRWSAHYSSSKSQCHSASQWAGAALAFYYASTMGGKRMNSLLDNVYHVKPCETVMPFGNFLVGLERQSNALPEQGLE